MLPLVAFAAAAVCGKAVAQMVEEQKEPAASHQHSSAFWILIKLVSSSLHITSVNVVRIGYLSQSAVPTLPMRETLS